MRKVLLCRTTHLVEIDGEISKDDQNEIWRIENLIGTDFYFEGISFEWISSNPVLLDTSKDNVGKCNNCGAWTTDCDRENPISDLSYGAHVDGQLLCDLCLPNGHPLKF